MIRSRLLILVGCLGMGQVLAQTVSPKDQKRSRNFENVWIDSLTKTVYYEQRLYRNPFIGLHEMRKVVKDSSIRDFVPLMQGIPIAKYRLGPTLEILPLSEQERLSYRALSVFPYQRRDYKFDFWIQPVFAARFGNFLKPVRSNASILLQSQVYLLPGLTLYWGVLFPITNELDNRPQIVRPAPVFLNKFYAKKDHFLSASLGFFHNDKYGLNVQYRRVDFNKPWSYGLEVGVTGNYYYPRGGIYYDQLYELLLLADVAYCFRPLDLTLKLTGGQFLWNDKGVRFDFIRQFANVEIGLFAFMTQNGSTAGFNFAVPIPPGKIIQGKKVRLRTTEEFRWEYLYAGTFKIGERYQVGYQLDQRLRQYHQFYLQRQYQQLK